MMLFLKFLILSILVLFPSNDSEKMPWSETRKLTWEDFQGRPDRSASYVASTNSGITFSYSVSGKNGEGELNWTVQSHFYPKLSWYKKEKVSDYILKHEQTHFDITELHARKLRKKLEGTRFSKKIKQEIESIYIENENERREMQQKFDSETTHSINREKELIWEIFVAEQLKVHSHWK